MSKKNVVWFEVLETLLNHAIAGEEITRDLLVEILGDKSDRMNTTATKTSVEALRDRLYLEGKTGVFHTLNAGDPKPKLTATGEEIAVSARVRKTHETLAKVADKILPWLGETKSAPDLFGLKGAGARPKVMVLSDEQYKALETLKL